MAEHSQTRRRRARNLLTQKYLKSILLYVPRTGALIWQWRADSPDYHNRRYAGTRAGTIREDGRRIVSINKQLFLATHIIWKIQTGRFPPKFVDHENVHAADDRWGNLRLATMSENNRNVPLQKNNVSGFKGVYWETRTQRWCARITFNRKVFSLGRFKDPRQAYQKYCEAAKKLHGKFARIA